MLKRVLTCLVLAALFLTASAQEKPKYVFLFIGDGMSIPQRMVAEEFGLKTGYGQLAINHLTFHATTRTCSATSLVTDSAAAGTAIACGGKTNNGALGVGPKGEKYESSAEVAHKNGKKVGILSTVSINDATPAAFYAHRASRGMRYEIGLDLVNSGFEFFAGAQLAKAEGKKGAAGYKGDVFDLAQKAGYQVLHTETEFRALKPGTGKVLYATMASTMPYTIDRTQENLSLADLTQKAIDFLDNPNGFFMMVEGGKVDYAGHANDAASNLHEVLDFDRAVKKAVAFAEKHPQETLIVVTGDHETGGMTMGFASTGYALYPERLNFQKCSVGAFQQKLAAAKKAKADFSFEDAKKMLNQDFGFAFTKDQQGIALSDGDVRTLEQAYRGNRLHDAARVMIASKAGIGWTTGAHSAMPVLTTSRGVGAENFCGLLDNTDISKKLKSLL